MNLHGLFQKLRPVCKPTDAITKRDLLDTEKALGNLTASYAKQILEQLKGLRMTTQELTTALNALTAQQGKIAKEQSDRFDAQTAAIKDLTDRLNAGGDVAPEVQAALAKLQETTQALDDAIPDAPTPA